VDRFEEVVEAVATFVFVGRGFSRDIQAHEKKGFIDGCISNVLSHRLNPALFTVIWHM
jgi:hypothetical protein